MSSKVTNDNSHFCSIIFIKNVLRILSSASVKTKFSPKNLEIMPKKSKEALQYCMKMARIKEILTRGQFTQFPVSCQRVVNMYIVHFDH